MLSWPLLLPMPQTHTDNNRLPYQQGTSNAPHYAGVGWKWPQQSAQCAAIASLRPVCSNLPSPLARIGPNAAAGSLKQRKRYTMLRRGTSTWPDRLLGPRPHLLHPALPSASQKTRQSTIQTIPPWPPPPRTIRMGCPLVH